MDFVKYPGGVSGRGHLLITRRVKPEKVCREIDWSLLVLFSGLFVVIAGVEKALLTGDIPALVKRLQLDRTGVVTVWSAILSNLVSNVPAVLVFKPFISTLTDPQHAWLTLAMSSTLAGNPTALGSIANLIVVERSRRIIKISFIGYLKVGVPPCLHRPGNPGYRRGLLARRTTRCGSLYGNCSCISPCTVSTWVTSLSGIRVKFAVMAWFVNAI